MEDDSLRFRLLKFEGPVAIDADPEPYSKLEEEPGVYMVVSVLDVGTAGEKLDPDSDVYDPAAQGLKTRIKGHNRKPQWREHAGKGQLAVLFAGEANTEARLGTEAWLRRYLAPLPCGSEPLSAPQPD